MNYENEVEKKNFNFRNINQVNGNINKLMPDEFIDQTNNRKAL